MLAEQELPAWVDKLLRFEQEAGAPSGKALFVADDTDSVTGRPDPLFREASDTGRGDRADARRVHWARGESEKREAAEDGPDGPDGPDARWARGG